ncbi:UDP-N-acetylglucosamine pyrophosphorylase mmy [Brevipalpus obovatus]|uniref:UDP-N-acetylglucosamine pyrophosphorylase mmy n=1 Tax=Brevipalpus obovatus TaxID=246614 RepID=UPI003D9E6A8B
MKLENDVDKLRQQLKSYNQEHLLQFWNLLTDDQKVTLYNDLKTIDFDEVCSTFQESAYSTKEGSINDDLLEPLSGAIHSGVKLCSEDQLEAYRTTGLKEISENHVAALLMAGGQGTRLGVDYPKGMYNVGLPSGKTLFQLQGERIRRLQRLATEKFGKECHITWYIMTSEHTKGATEKFFDSHDYFGLSKERVVIFEQGTLPCFTFDGKIIMDKCYRIARAPDGNGGLYRSLRDTGVLDHMKETGIKYVHVYGVDNILVKMADPTFIGYCLSKGAVAGAKVVEKVSPSEAVGVICKVKGKFKVVEYSEVSNRIAEQRNDDGRLTFCCGSICNHFFTVDFLCDVSGKKLKHHVAKKKIPFVNGKGVLEKPEKPNGIKMEKFVFDVFEFAKDFVVWEVIREDEFSPLKNSDSAESDCPRTARQSIFDLHRKYLIQAGAIIPDDSSFECEISPLVTHEGEGLEKFVKGKKLTSPFVLEMGLTNSYTNGKSNGIH